MAFSLGEKTPSQFNPAFFVQDDFRRCLHVLEAIYRYVENTGFEDDLSKDYRIALSASEVDLGVKWQPPAFVRTGAPLLDEHLVNEPLRWLSEPR